MSKIIQCFGFGSCGIQSAQRLLALEGFATNYFAPLGFSWRPFALSSGAAVQHYDFCAGERLAPDVIRLAYKERHQPTVETREAVDRCEIALVELSTPIEPIIFGKVANLNNIRQLVVMTLRDSSVDLKLVGRWASALSEASDDLEENADALLAEWPDDIDDDGLARRAVENLSARRLSVDDMVRDLEGLRERLGKPMVLNLYQWRYMPDGRAVDWPDGFKAEQIEVARRVGLPTLDLAPQVARFGPKRLISADMAHWRPETRPLQAELTYDFLAETLGRPRLASYPESVRLRRKLWEAFPELADPSALIPDPTPPAGPAIADDRSPDGPAAAPAPAPGVSTDAGPLADRLNRALIDFHRRRLHQLAFEDREAYARHLEGGGFYARYHRILENGTLVGFREESVLEIIDSELPPYDRYAIMRADFGELALLVAASGRKVTAFEPNRQRRAAIEAGAFHLESIGLLEPGALATVASLTPQAPLQGRVLGIGLKVAEQSEADAAPHLAGLASFDALLVDLRRFPCRRDDPADQKSAARKLRNMGFNARDDYEADDLSWFHRSGRAAPLSRAAGAR